MSKVTPCNEVVPGCGFAARGQDDGEVLNCATEHIREIHGVNDMTPELNRNVRAAIHDESCGTTSSP